MDYNVYGDYGYVTEQVLFESNSRNEAIRWAKNYTRRDLGGYAVIEVASFAKCGEYITHWAIQAEEEEGILYDEM